MRILLHRQLKEMKTMYYSCTITHTDRTVTSMVTTKINNLPVKLGDTITLTTHETFKDALIPLLPRAHTITQTKGVLLHMPDGRTEVFKTASDAGRFLNVTPQAVVNLLEGKKHYKSVKGARVEKLENVINGLQWALSQQYEHEIGNDMYYTSPQRKEDEELIAHWQNKLSTITCRGG